MDDTFDPEQYNSMCKRLNETIMTAKDPDKAIRTLSLMTMLYFCAARSDESQSIQFCDFGKPLTFPSIGPSPFVRYSFPGGEGGGRGGVAP